ncbi:LLM class flavin-dependent oxidoreductase [Paenibacillus medicaginis]|uniref:LLM class flavin-dependent oxidoreductase n=1 Tax=Paenibacillus medicaginis TaxID=1470560 RepID=A0ABV5BVE0_9BACL
MTELVERLNNKYNRNDSLPNFHKKLSKGTIRYGEILEIAEVLDYKIAWIPKDTQTNNGVNSGVIFSSAPDNQK